MYFYGIFKKNRAAKLVKTKKKALFSEIKEFFLCFRVFSKGVKSLWKRMMD